MSRFRLFLAWLIVAAIPLQGVAAASMLFCGPGPQHASAQVAATQHGKLLGAVDAKSAHDHAEHGHDAEVQFKAKNSGEDGSKKLPDITHKCGICASCCHSVAIAEFPQLVAFAPVPQAELDEPIVLIHARPSPVPDKPPRA